MPDPRGFAAEPAAESLDRLDRYDWLVLGSPDDLSRLLARLACLGTDTRRLAEVKLAAIGRDTADRLAECCIRPDLAVPRQSGGEAPNGWCATCRGQRVLLAYADGGSGKLAEALAAVASRLDEMQGARPNG